MARLTPFGYRPGKSILHRLDARLKFFMVCAIGLSMVKAGPVAVAGYSVLACAGFKISRIPVIETCHALRFFFLLLFFVWTARALSDPGTPLFQWAGISVTREGLFSGLLMTSKFFLIMVTGLIFSSTTAIKDVKASVQWALAPVPLIPENRVAVMIGLSLGFIPMIFKQGGQIADARQARCANQIKNPVKRTIGLALPLIKKTFASADYIALAMASRLYSDDRTPPSFSPSGKEPAFILLTLVVVVGMLFF